MKISQILNNNVAIVKRGSNEIIVYAKGISFKKNKGDTISPEEIERTYVLDSHDMLEHFSYLLSNTKEEYIQLVNQMILYGEEHLKEKISDYLYFTLLDHVDFTIKRIKKEQFIRSPLCYEIKKFYPLHYQVGQYAVELIKKELRLDCPDDEAASIALHFINMQNNNNIDESIQIMDTVKDILSIIKYHFQISFDEKSINYTRLITHIQYFAQRLVHNEFYESSDNDLYKEIKKMYPQSYHCVQKIKKYVDDVYRCHLSDEEETYLILHIHRVTYRDDK